MLVVPAMQNDRTSLGPRREFCNHLLAPLPSCPTAQPCFNAMLLAHDVKLSPRKEIPLPTLGYEAGFHTQQYILVFPLPEGCLIGCNPVRHTKTSSSLGVWKQKVPEGLCSGELDHEVQTGRSYAISFSSFSLFIFLHAFHPDPTFYRVSSPGYIAKDDFKHLLLSPPPPGC